MAQQNNDILYKVINIAIIGAVIVGLWYLYKWAKDHIGGNGGTLFGGPGKEPENGNEVSKVVNQVKTVGDKIADAYKKEIGHPTHIKTVAYELQLADRSAKKYDHKPGTNIVINKALKAANSLSDADFVSAVKEFLSLQKARSLYDTEIAGAQITGLGRSAFLNRYKRLIGI